MKIKQLSETVNINEYPSKIEPEDSNLQLVVGDLHGNALKLLYILVRHGILEISRTDYERLCAIYLKDYQDLTKSDLEEFQTILNEATFHQNAFVSLIGDCFADRGSNDYFTLLILTYLSKHNVQYEMVLSNHDAEFICAYETKEKFEPMYLDSMFTRSMINMQYLIDNKLLDADTIKEMIKNVYKPKLKLISYTLSQDKQEISIGAHAGIGIDNIQFTADKLGITLDDSSAENLAKSIDNINAKFQSEYVQRNQVNSLFNSFAINIGYRGYEFSLAHQKEFPIEFLMWNRYYHYLKRNPSYKGYAINYIHGHDPLEKSLNNIFNIDNTLGKNLNLHKAIYNILVCEKEIKSLDHMFSVQASDVDSSLPPISSTSSSSASSSYSSSSSSSSSTAEISSEYHPLKSASSSSSPSWNSSNMIGRRSHAVKGKIARAFQFEAGNQFLQIINQHDSLIAILNQWTPTIAEKFANILNTDKVNFFKKANVATQFEFLRKFALQNDLDIKMMNDSASQLLPHFNSIHGCLKSVCPSENVANAKMRDFITAFKKKGKISDGYNQLTEDFGYEDVKFNDTYSQLSDAYKPVAHTQEVLRLLQKHFTSVFSQEEKELATKLMSFLFGIHAYLAQIYQSEQIASAKMNSFMRAFRANGKISAGYDHLAQDFGYDDVFFNDMYSQLCDEYKPSVHTDRVLKIIHNNFRDLLKNDQKDKLRPSM